MRARINSLIACVIASVLISACGILKPYQAELGQGNFVRTEQVEQLEIGQTARQVLFVLGKPLLTGENQNERWIYTLFSEADGYRNIVIQFKDGIVTDIQVPMTD